MTNQEASVQREIAGLRSDVSMLSARMDAGFVTTTDLQRQTNGRLRKAELEIELAKERERLRDELRVANEHRRERRDRWLLAMSGIILTSVLATASAVILRVL